MTSAALYAYYTAEDERRLFDALRDAAKGVFKPCYCGAPTLIGDLSRGCDCVMCSRTMYDIVNCKPARQALAKEG